MSDDSVFGMSEGSDFDAAPKPKAKAAPKKSAAAKPKAAPKKQTTLKAPKAPKTTKAAPKKRAKPLSDDENNDIDMDDDDDMNDDSLLSITPPSAKRQKKAPGLKKSSGKVLAEIDNDSFDVDDMPRAAGGSTDKYQKLTQLEHIIKRPDTYIGSVEPTKSTMWVYNSSTEAMESREITYTPGLYKIFDEILVNAADNKQADPKMDTIKVTIDREKGEISVENNGKGIPVEIHDKEGIYIPEMIFGHLLTSSNYDDDQQKVTGGRNGYGAKLCNVFSTQFQLETSDKVNNKKYSQTWTNNMSKMGAAKITKPTGKDFTKVTFRADFKRFNMDGMDDDFEALAKRRVYDLAGTCVGVKVWLNGERIPVNSFKKYMEMYTKALRSEQAQAEGEETAKKTDVILTDEHDRWQIGFAVSDGSFQQVSFVNSIATTSGGTHVNYIADQIIDKLMAFVKKRNKGGVQLKNAHIKNHIFLFVNSLIVNPAFTSQTKEQLTTKVSQFGSKVTVSEKFLNAIVKTEAVANIMHFAQQKADQVLKKSDGGKRQRMNNAKLTDANKAGTKDGYRCTLILTEGDSAMALALAGRAVVNPDLFGVFPLRGKLLNVRDASIDTISKNQEIQNIKKFIGLQHKKEYLDTKNLRYGHIMIMTDQDHDGSHIKGLLINFLQVQYPSLLKIEGFLMQFLTPIVKTWKGDIKKPTKSYSFFTMPEYEDWKEQPGHQKGWDHKYFKGLGTSRPEDAQVYFRDLDKHLKEFHTMKDTEVPLIEMAFSKTKADARKEWIGQFVPGTYIDLTVPKISYDDFVNKELILYSMADNLRSIPSVVDGFKPGQRKIIYTCFKRNLKKDTKVVDLAGSVTGMTDYAYGDASMQQTITGLAQNFVGSNNINCLEPSGNFGSRLQGGADAASARYIYTRLSPFARKIFHQSDEALLTYQESDGHTIEPDWYVPILPMVLVNGADGIGTGWSTNIPNYKPEDIIDNLKRRMTGSKEDMMPMTPWFRGFAGGTEDIGNKKFKFTGTIRQTSDNEIEITELPVRIWTQDFKEKLETIIRADKVPSFIKDYTEYNTHEKVHFIIKMEDKHMTAALAQGLEEAFKLYKTMGTTNLVAFDHQGRMQKYETALDIMEEFYQVRLKYYQLRKEHLLSEMQKELDKLSNQSRFIKMIIDGDLVVSKKKKAVLVEELARLKFKRFPKVADAKKMGEMEQAQEDEDAEDEEAGLNDFDYLLGMAIWSLTQERVDKLLKQIGDKEVEIDMLIKLTPKDLWITDLDDFLNEWHSVLDEDAKEAKRIARLGRRTSTKLGIGGGKGGKGKKRKVDDSDDFSDDDFEIKKPKKAAAKPSSMLSYLKKADPSKPSGSKALISALGGEAPVVKSSASSTKDDVDMEDLGSVNAPTAKPASKAKKPTVAPAKKSSKAAKKDDSEDDVFAELAEEEVEEEEVIKKPAPRGGGRVAAKKTASYALSDDDSDEDADDFDVSKMVKGIGAGSKDNSRQLFSESARPSSKQGLAARPVARPTPKVVDLSEDMDTTDFAKLVPQPSPERPTARAVDTLASDSDDDDLPVLAKTKITVKPSAKAAAKPAVKPKVAPKAAVVAKKTMTLSPAGKAYAAKQAKAAAKTAPKKEVVQDDSDEDMDESADVLANELLDDDDDNEDESIVKPRAAARRRPGRAAATKKAKYAVSDDDSEEEEEEEESFVVDDDSE